MKLIWWLGLVGSRVMTQSISGSACAIMNKAMYITGGKTDQNDYTNLIQVNLTKSFDVSEFQIKDGNSVSVSSLGSNVGLPNYGAIFGSGVTGTKLWMMGSSNSQSVGNLRYFDLASGKFNTNPIKSGVAPTTRHAFAWSQYDGKFYACGGNVTQTKQLSTEFWQLDTTKGWTRMPTSSSIPAVQYHQATIYNNENFMVLGGQLPNGDIRDLSQVWIFNFKKNSWSIQNTQGGNNIPMVKFTPIVYGDKIIIQGGANHIDSTTDNYQIYSGLMVLDTKTWKWTSISLKDSDGQILNTARAGYSAWLVGNQIVQFLGEFNATLPTPSQAQIISLDNYTVVKNYTPPDPNWFQLAYQQDDHYHPSNRTGLIVGLTVGIVFIILLAALLIVLYRRRVRKLEREFMPADPILNPIDIAPEVIWAGGPTTLSGLTTTTSPRNSSLDPAKPVSPQNRFSHPTPSPPEEPPNPLFDLQYTTLIPGENREDIINERFEH